MSLTIRTALAAALLAGGVGQAGAEADGPDHYRVTGVEPGDRLNIRAAPSANARKVGSIPPGSACVRNLGCQGGLTLAEYSALSRAEQQERLKAHPRWCRVEYQGTTGWVAGRFLEEGDCP